MCARPGITTVPGSPALRAVRSHSHKTTTPVAWQLSPGSESTALRFLLSAGAVNLTKRGPRQTCKTSDLESSDISRDWIPGIKGDKEMKEKLQCGTPLLGFRVSGDPRVCLNRHIRICDKHDHVNTLTTLITDAICLLYLLHHLCALHYSSPFTGDRSDYPSVT